MIDLFYLQIKSVDGESTEKVCVCSGNGIRNDNAESLIVRSVEGVRGKRIESTRARVPRTLRAVSVVRACLQFISSEECWIDRSVQQQTP